MKNRYNLLQLLSALAGVVLVTSGYTTAYSVTGPESIISCPPSASCSKGACYYAGRIAPSWYPYMPPTGNYRFSYASYTPKGWVKIACHYRGYNGMPLVLYNHYGPQYRPCYITNCVSSAWPLPSGKDRVAICTSSDRSACSFTTIP